MKDLSGRIILASASPRRKELLEKAGLDFDVLPADIDESKIRAASPRLLVKRLSRAKARAIDRADGAVIGADTVVVYGGMVYGKPHTKDNAVAMLSKLCGRWHSVYTGVTVVYGGRETCFCVRSRVKLKALSIAQIADYVDEINPIDKAGAYGIQDGRLVEKYKGSYTNIVGLPMEKLSDALGRAGVIDD